MEFGFTADFSQPALDFCLAREQHQVIAEAVIASHAAGYRPNKAMHLTVRGAEHHQSPREGRRVRSTGTCGIHLSVLPDSPRVSSHTPSDWASAQPKPARPRLSTRIIRFVMPSYPLSLQEVLALRTLNQRLHGVDCSITMRIEYS